MESSQEFRPVYEDYLSTKTQQQSGEVEQPNQHFGPAQREFYDAGKWGMVQYNTEENVENDMDMTPSVRFRDVNERPLLIPNDHGKYLAPLMIILHSIPLAREAILNAPQPDCVSDYGFDPYWWNGSFIDMNEYFPTRQSQHCLERISVECQRLMAFLDGGSKRPFAEIHNLALLAPPYEAMAIFRGENAIETPVATLLQDLSTQWGVESPYSKTFVTTVETDNAEQSETFTNLILEVTVALNESLYDLIDELVWPPNRHDETADAHLDEISNIIHLTIKRDDGQSGAGIDLLTTWYPDRYRKEFKPYIQEINRRTKSIIKEISELTKKKFQFSTSMGKDSSKLLQITLEYLNQVQGDQRSNDLGAAIQDVERIRNEFEQHRSYLNDRVTELQDTIKRYKQFFKQPVTPGTDELLPGREEMLPDLRPYRLCGIIVSPTEYYYCIYENVGIEEPEDLIEIDGVDDVDNQSNTINFLWYKVTMSASNEPVCSESSEEEALQHAKSGSNKYQWQEVIAIYANDFALNRAEHALPLNDKLKRFIMLDKKAMIKQVSELGDSMQINNADDQQEPEILVYSDSEDVADLDSKIRIIDQDE